MNYTKSDSYSVHALTGNRMHDQAKSIPTEVSDADMNQLNWSMMEVIKDAGLSGVDFNKNDPESYRKLLAAIKIQALRVGVNHSTWAVYLAPNSIIPSTDSGKAIQLNLTSSGTVYLPKIAACPRGASFRFLNTSNTTTATITPQSPDGLSVGPIDIAPGEDLWIVCGDVWFAFGGAASLRYTSSFAASFNDWSGVIRLPSAFIQTAYASSNASGICDVIFNKAFKKIPIVTAIHHGGGAGLIVLPSVTRTGCRFKTYGTGTLGGEIGSSIGFCWIAIGEI